MVEILLYGTIGIDVTAADIKAQIADADGDDIVVRIDSPGGSVFQGFSIQEAFRDYAGKKRAVIESAAFSIASYITTAFADVEIAPNGYLMLHNPHVEAAGDDEKLEREAINLRKLKDTMIAGYAAKSGIPAEEIKQILADETYLDASEALERGFVSKVLGEQITSRALAGSNKLPSGIYRALCCVDSGKETPTAREVPMPENTPASIQEIQKAFPKASSDFVLDCIKNELPMASVAESAAANLQSEKEELVAKMTAMEEEMKAMKDKMSAMEEDHEASASASGSEPVAQAGNEQPSQTAGQKWNEAVALHIDAGLSRDKAVRKANKQNPGLRAQMLAEING